MPPSPPNDGGLTMPRVIDLSLVALTLLWTAYGLYGGLL